VFARLNSYTVSLNEAEKRHARFQGDFKFAIRAASRKWGLFWSDYGILSTEKRVRMQDDALTAEMVGILLEGLRDGGDPKINALYVKYDQKFDPAVIKKFDKVLKYFTENFADTVRDTPLLSPPHLLTVFGALAYLLVGIPDGELTHEELKLLPKKILKDHDTIYENLLTLASLIGVKDGPGEPYSPFWKASSSSTQRISSRRVRFAYYVHAFGTDNL
jgi:hypothetical protein